MSEREERVAKNEAVFREVNERISDITDHEELIEFLCECSDMDCIAPVSMTQVEYEHVRSEATWFFVVPGHSTEDIETVVIERPRFHVVQKREGVPAEVAVETDPRG